MVDSFEEIKRKITSEFKPDRVIKGSKQSHETLVCDYATSRLDHWTCGDEDCDCYDTEGWCEEQWREECETPLLKSVDEFVKKTFSAETLKKYSIKRSVSEKGTLFITVSLVEEEEEEEPDKKRLKV